MDESVPTFRWLDLAEELLPWQAVQDELAHLTGLSLILLDSRGAPLSRVSRSNPLCEAVQRQPQGVQHCQHYCGRSVAHTLQRQQSLLFRCHANLVSFAVPVFLEEGHGVVVRGGHVFLSAVDYKTFLDRAKELGLEDQEVAALSQELTVRDGKALRDACRFVETVGRRCLVQMLRFRRLQQRQEQASALLGVYADLASQPAQDPGTLLEALGVIFDLEGVCLTLRESRTGWYRVQASYGKVPKSLLEHATPPEEGLAADLKDAKTPLRMDSPNEWLRLGLPADEALESLVVFPIRRQENLEGWVWVINTPLSKEACRLVGDFVQAVGLLQEIHRLRQELEKTQEGFLRLVALGESLWPLTDTESLSKAILHSAVSLLGAEQGSLMLFREESDELVVTAAVGIPASLAHRIRKKPGEGIAGIVLERGQPLLVQDIETHRAIRQKNRPRYKTRSFLSLPLKVDSRKVGVLNLADKATGEAFQEPDLQKLQPFLQVATLALDRVRLAEERAHLQQLSMTDGLTGLANRRYFQKRLGEELRRAIRSRKPLGLILVDLDYFKPYNDQYGHMAGDEVLRLTAACLQNTVRAMDVVARLGGDEFAVLLPETNRELAMAIAERIRQEVSRTYVPHKEPPSGLTASLGLAVYPKDGEDAETLLYSADRALYMAKSQGRNRVCGTE